MREIAAAENGPVRSVRRSAADAIEVGLPVRLRAFDDAGGNGGYAGIGGHGHILFRSLTTPLFHRSSASSATALRRFPGRLRAPSISAAAMRPAEAWPGWASPPVAGRFGLSKHLFLAAAFDMQHQIAGILQAGEGEGEAGFAGAFRFHGNHAAWRRGVERLFKARPPGKNEAVWPSVPMPSTTTSRGRRGLPSSRSRSPRPLPQSRPPDRAERNAPQQLRP